MQDSSSVIVQAADGFARDLARRYDVSLPRMYEILGRDNPYPKAIRLALAIGAVNPAGLLLIRDDFVRRCESVEVETPTITLPELNGALHDVPQSILENKSPGDRKREILEAISALYRELHQVDRRAVN